MKIHSLELIKRKDENIPLEELQTMVGWVEPNEETLQWQVTCMDGSRFCCDTQIQAEILANTEEIKALLITQKLEVEAAQEQAQQMIAELGGNPMGMLNALRKLNG